MGAGVGTSALSVGATLGSDSAGTGSGELDPLRGSGALDVDSGVPGIDSAMLPEFTEDSSASGAVLPHAGSMRQRMPRAEPVKIRCDIVPPRGECLNWNLACRDERYSGMPGLEIEPQTQLNLKTTGASSVVSELWARHSEAKVGQRHTCDRQ